MKRFFYLLSFAFAFLGVLGAGYMLYAQESVGFTLVPVLLCLACTRAYTELSKKDRE